MTTLRVDNGVNRVDMMQDTNQKYQIINTEQSYTTQDVDAYADNVDNLMDDLFGEVETTLHVDYAKQRSLKQKSGQAPQPKAPYASVNSSSSDMVALSKFSPADRDISTSKDTINITKLNLADISLPPISKQDVLWIQPYITQNPEQPSDIAPVEPVTQKYNLFDRILFVGACSAALLAAIMWTVNHGIWLGRQSVNIVQSSPKNLSANKATDSKPFAEEISRMLSDLTNKNRAIATNPNGAMPLGSNIPLMSVPLMTSSGLSNPFANNMQQPMYVPVYQPPSMNGNGSNLPSPLALPPATSNGAIEVGSNAAPPTSQNSTFIQASAAPVASYTLIGVLDLGDRSTAMFDMNGSVQSIGLGKAISNTGWSVLRVNQQEITIKRGKETKTVLVGQRF